MFWISMIRKFVNCLALGSHRIFGCYPVIRLSGYPACFSGIRLSGRIAGDIRPDSRIITKLKLIWRRAKYTSENKNVLDNFYSFTTSPSKIEDALSLFMSNIFWTTVPFITFHLTATRTTCYISHLMILAQNKIG